VHRIDFGDHIYSMTISNCWHKHDFDWPDNQTDHHFYVENKIIEWCAAYDGYSAFAHHECYGTFYFEDERDKLFFVLRFGNDIEKVTI
jgi:hypothetical protein